MVRNGDRVSQRRKTDRNADAGELIYGLDRPEGEGRFYTKDALAELVRKTERPILVVTGSEKRAREMPASPEKSYRRSGDLFLVHYRPKGEKHP